jgi:UDP-galactopyranose mutase
MITIVGCGLFGATCARLLKDKRYDVKIIEQRPVVGGTCYDVLQHGIRVHKHGAHIFHTNHETVWKFVNRFATFNHYIHKVLSFVEGQYISLPPNNMTYQQLGCPDHSYIYEKLFKGYSQKQWGADVPETAVARIPFRNTFDDRYFTDKYQGIPCEGYTRMIRKMINGIPLEHRQFTLEQANSTDTIIYSGSLDELFNYRHGKLEYRSLTFREEEHDGDYQGIAVVNYPSPDVPFTRTIEHKHFYYQECDHTVVTYEHPCPWNGTNERYYPVPTAKNQALYAQYQAGLPKNVIVGGRLGTYRYMNMDAVVKQALEIGEAL